MHHLVANCTSPKFQPRTVCSFSAITWGKQCYHPLTHTAVGEPVWCTKNLDGGILTEV